MTLLWVLLLAALVSLAAVGLAGLRRSRSGTTRHHEIATRTTSADGTTVRLRVRATLTLEPLVSPGATARQLDAMNESLRCLVQQRDLLGLPGLGDQVTELAAATEPGIRVDAVRVIGADVELTRELRRLVGGP